eukprot:COSAG01_NODE_27754_length_677_cov_5.461938_1_plen_64_part_10
MLILKTPYYLLSFIHSFFNKIREISDLGHFGGGHIPMWVMDPKIFRFGSVLIYQTPTLSNHSDL